jgi:hypothetical protein
MDLGKLVSMLAHRALYFPVVASLGVEDQLEAVRPNLPAESTDIERCQGWCSYLECRCTYFVNCWHCSPTESASMWKIYGGRNQGIAIKSTFQLLSSAFPSAAQEDTGQLVRPGLVEYMDPDKEEAMPRQLDLDAQVLRKRDWYSDEKELRLIFSIPNNMVPGKDGPSPKHPGIWISCDLQKAVQGIVVAPQSPPYLESAVREVIKRFNFDPALIRPSRLNETFLPPVEPTD